MAGDRCRSRDRALGTESLSVSELSANTPLGLPCAPSKPPRFALPSGHKPSSVPACGQFARSAASEASVLATKEACADDSFWRPLETPDEAAPLRCGSSDHTCRCEACPSFVHKASLCAEGGQSIEGRQTSALNSPEFTPPSASPSSSMCSVDDVTKVDSLVSEKRGAFQSVSTAASCDRLRHLDSSVFHQLSSKVPDSEINDVIPSECPDFGATGSGTGSEPPSSCIPGVRTPAARGTERSAAVASTNAEDGGFEGLGEKQGVLQTDTNGFSRSGGSLRRCTSKNCGKEHGPQEPTDTPGSSSASQRLFQLVEKQEARQSEIALSSSPSCRAASLVDGRDNEGETASNSPTRVVVGSTSTAPSPSSRSSWQNASSCSEEGRKMLTSSASSTPPSRDRRIVFVYALLFLDVIIIGSTSAQHSFNPASLIDKVLMTHASFPSAAPSHVEGDAGDLPYHRLLPHSVKRELGLSCVCGWAALVVLGILTLLFSTSSMPLPLHASAYRRRQPTEGADGAAGGRGTPESVDRRGGPKKSGQKARQSDETEERRNKGKKTGDRGDKLAGKGTERRGEAGVAAAVEMKFKEYEEVVLSQYGEATLTQVKMRTFFIALATLLVFFIMNFILQINVQCHRTKHQLGRLHALAAEAAENSGQVPDVRGARETGDRVPAAPLDNDLHALDSVTLVKAPSLPGEARSATAHWPAEKGTETPKHFLSSQGEAHIRLASLAASLVSAALVAQDDIGDNSGTASPLSFEAPASAAPAGMQVEREEGEMHAEERRQAPRRGAAEKGERPYTEASLASSPSAEVNQRPGLETASTRPSTADDAGDSDLQEAPRSPSYVYYRDFWFWHRLVANCLRDAELHMSVAWIAMHVAGIVFCVRVTRDVTDALKAAVDAFRLF
ncbi:conserved hypothetical protein [Neospora caninum Liverpool]|uniref:Transmembrane protein n=1 Tax=Neospora caninum (strain Liverpool) TaxID=572307 RepID=F0VBE9_NEOCL|nr:conserved hypothetical protein [Neospora caninum Liverpool]CBZ50933.1 conserved hypothetical protein [Neospora caninum Liverpool]CEL68234.1 TPA: hypothetical protein BN1204_040080 [Neospora caninum Liverpool]|eukprot:XP_003880966.1 conserved hypothetical protein [Neospora caninum Liverpool]